jgi:hypothetical protein
MAILTDTPEELKLEEVTKICAAHRSPSWKTIAKRKLECQRNAP